MPISSLPISDLGYGYDPFYIYSTIVDLVVWLYIALQIMFMATKTGAYQAFETKFKAVLRFGIERFEQYHDTPSKKRCKYRRPDDSTSDQSSSENLLLKPKDKTTKLLELYLRQANDNNNTIGHWIVMPAMPTTKYSRMLLGSYLITTLLGLMYLITATLIRDTTKHSRMLLGLMYLISHQMSFESVKYGRFVVMLTTEDQMSLESLVYWIFELPALLGLMLGLMYLISALLGLMYLITATLPLSGSGLMYLITAATLIPDTTKHSRIPDTTKHSRILLGQSATLIPDGPSQQTKLANDNNNTILGDSIVMRDGRSQEMGELEMTSNGLERRINIPDDDDASASYGDDNDDGGGGSASSGDDGDGDGDGSASSGDDEVQTRGPRFPNGINSAILGFTGQAMATIVAANSPHSFSVRLFAYAAGIGFYGSLFAALFLRRHPNIARSLFKIGVSTSAFTVMIALSPYLPTQCYLNIAVPAVACLIIALMVVLSQLD